MPPSWLCVQQLHLGWELTNQMSVLSSTWVCPNHWNAMPNNLAMLAEIGQESTVCRHRVYFSVLRTIHDTCIWFAHYRRASTTIWKEKNWTRLSNIALYPNAGSFNWSTIFLRTIKILVVTCVMFVWEHAIFWQDKLV
jgi:hypothetical protein